MKPIAVIGAGPVGSILSAHLIKGGHEVILVDVLRDRLLTMQRDGIRVHDPKNHITGSFTLPLKKFAFSTREIKEEPSYFFIAVKTYNLDQVVEDLKEVFSPPSKIVIYQNGLDNEDYVAEIFGKENVLRCVINYAGGMRSQNEVEVTFFNRPNYIGSIGLENSSCAKELAEILTKTGIETRYTDEIKKYEWEKAILNACLAPISAVTGLTMKEVMETKGLRKMVEYLLMEGIEVAEKLGIRLPPIFFDYSIDYLSKGGYHKPSMLVDIERGLETEVDYLNGRIVHYGEGLNLSVPYNRMITILIKGIVQRKKKERERG